ncbi:hypothetical protein [Gloeocapsopsis dulcis]|uniref:Lipoprotein n=1 Tax=Gloeocapsopsis dulcis AAB1 = 1H9 TaxID=1433147 RepID=A0A6N8FYV2_9CHRO|nr:hypothetical protein [Gloeocapsopsis dulcis]MUL37096.1 hypothetical protein [Gloeocapsopsis dulcis AAB1 = 1H9]WNN88380.1 hypothetical protein P0S91_19115 [Gloeocapsopsis dulcis]
MKPYQLNYLISSIFLLSTITACYFPSTKDIANSNSDQAQPTDTQEPSTKTAIINIEGEKTTISLELYSHPLFTTYFPAQDFIPESVASGEGTAVWFYANFGGTKNEAAYVQFFFPGDANTLDELKQNWIEGENGLLASNGWRVIDTTPKVAYPWAKEKISFHQPEKNITGTVYLGEAQGNAFYVVTHYPVEYGDGFTPRSDVILQNLDTE